jgi:hypothetical protein
MAGIEGTIHAVVKRIIDHKENESERLFQVSMERKGLNHG